jgi:gluconate 2-dehydrogenase gamma chain
MDEKDFSRRSFLRSVAAALGVAGLTLDFDEVARAAQSAHVAMQRGSAPQPSFLTAAEAADVEAITAQIIPSDATPGAREAGAALFIDAALASFFSRMADAFRAGLKQFQAECSAHHEGAAFAALRVDQQLAFLGTVEHTPFFGTMQLLTVFGTFAMPGYGGNRDGVGWKLLGFEDQHVFEPPFGYYDRDYPGFAAAPDKAP